MKTCGALLVLLCCCLAEMQLGGETASTNEIPTCQPDIYTVLTEMSNRLRASEDQLKAIQRENAESRVAFSVSLETTATSNIYTGPYKHIFVNTGNAYNPDTGFFTAPVKGVYDFSYNAYGASKLGVYLRRNGQKLISVYTNVSGSINASNGVSVLLEVGDVVDIQLTPKDRIVDNVNHHSTFRGHLLFKM